MADWVSFWDSEHSIYVNARHRDVHYGRIADDVRRYVPSPGAVVLDYGCGEALHADRIAQAASQLILCEAAPKVRAGLAARFQKMPTIAVRTPEEVTALPDVSLDYIVMHSVAQYLTPEELSEKFALFRRLLRPNGRFLLGDVIPPNVSAATDAAALVSFAAANGFLGAALVGLARTALSDYWRLRSQLGLRRYSAEEMTRMLAAARFLVRRAPANVGHNAARMTFLARPV